MSWSRIINYFINRQEMTIYDRNNSNKRIFTVVFFKSVRGEMMLKNYLEENGWEIANIQKIKSREKKLVSYNDLNITEQVRRYLELNFREGIYVHQKEALKSLLDNQNVCLLTGTASGKSMVFYANGIETLAKNNLAKIIAIYPLKALGREQEIKWQKAISDAGLSAKVGRIDGDINISRRKNILKNSQVIIMTPDIIHIWLLANLGDKDIIKFLINVSLIVVDEVHTYTGVFGSNSAFLFRRLRHLMAIGNKFPQFICASATIKNPDSHLEKLFGVPFALIGSELDTSPKNEVEILLLIPPRMADFLTEITRFLKEVSKGPDRFITFIDSRKQTEMISSILARGQIGEEDEHDSIDRTNSTPLESLNILPYRAGYEEYDQEIIQKRLTQGQLKGVVSTSALELGLDIPYLGIAVLIGVPYSATSLFLLSPLIEFEPYPLIDIN